MTTSSLVMPVELVDHPVGMADADALDLGVAARLLRGWTSPRLLRGGRLRRRLLRAAAFAAAFFTSAASTGCSRVMLRGALSSRRPWKTEWRIRPSGVHSPNETSATSSGLTQWPLTSRGFSKNGRRLAGEAVERLAQRRERASGRSRCRRRRRSGARRVSSWMPSSSEPKPVREPFGSVQPPITNSWRCVHLSLIQVGRAPRDVGRIGALADHAFEAASGRRSAAARAARRRSSR